MPLTLKLVMACLAGVATAAHRFGAQTTAMAGIASQSHLDDVFPLAKRDDNCDGDHHSCRDVGYPDQCCPNNAFCFINNTMALGCCRIGRSCNTDTICSSTMYQCVSSRTVSGSVTAQTGCCQRRCQATSQFLCPSDLSGGCCPYGSECREGGNCVVEVTSRTSPTLLATPFPEACSNSQERCADGPNCCEAGLFCTQLEGQDWCVPAQATGSGNGDTEEGSSSDGLSDGAMAGVVVGAVVGGGLLIGALVYFFFFRRRRSRKQQQPPATQPSGSIVRPTDDGAMTEITASSMPRRNRGGTQDYFGPVAMSGPYTETEFSSPAPSPGIGRALTEQPHGPNDITGAVELGSVDNMVSSPRSMSLGSVYETPMSETMYGRLELSGDGAAPRRSGSVQQTPNERP
ncbi:hypothetical protein S7711_04600 [Stachybotrys chartarum IBT 7711]|uniref:Mid2 domain-containing protein n=1 Tax=Stachybotrys chartarum (strain CBS 109288 / IBT 7711) TaxID=1280523 RepID=A0A084AUF4_STACB|nr:hypothetical protein S7711_04600 [Stachybotrys chartarum IBT 7711]KFA52023.1 hypothetical protein S40293_03000 [Stachybotrys chartarum IBT 40293]